jgi:hypothetical protein
MSRARVMFARRFALTCIAAIGLFAARSAAGQGRAPVYDRVILGVRVIDPESRLDASRNVGISGGSIAVVTAASIRAATGSTHMDSSSLRDSSIYMRTGRPTRATATTRAHRAVARIVAVRAW